MSSNKDKLNRLHKLDMHLKSLKATKSPMERHLRQSLKDVKRIQYEMVGVNREIEKLAFLNTEAQMMARIREEVNQLKEKQREAKWRADQYKNDMLKKIRHMKKCQCNVCKFKHV